MIRTLDPLPAAVSAQLPFDHLSLVAGLVEGECLSLSQSPRLLASWYCTVPRRRTPRKCRIHVTTILKFQLTNTNHPLITDPHTL